MAKWEKHQMQELPFWFDRLDGVVVKSIWFCDLRQIIWSLQASHLCIAKIQLIIILLTSCSCSFIQHIFIEGLQLLLSRSHSFGIGRAQPWLIYVKMYSKMYDMLDGIKCGGEKKIKALRMTRRIKVGKWLPFRRRAQLSNHWEDDTWGKILKKKRKPEAETELRESLLFWRKSRECSVV